MARDRVPPKKTAAKKTRATSGKSPQKKTGSKAAAPKSAGPKSGVRSNAQANETASANLHSISPFRIGFTFVVLIGFVVFLWNIKDSSENQRAVSTEQSSQELMVAAPKSEQKQDDLPEMPKEEWEFMTTLTDPDYEVEVELPDLPEVTDKEYVLQCGSFRQQSQAESMKARVAFQGLESEIRESNGSNGLWYRVVLGPYERKRAAEKDRHKLQAAGFTTCRIW